MSARLGVVLKLGGQLLIPASQGQPVDLSFRIKNHIMLGPIGIHATSIALPSPREKHLVPLGIDALREVKALQDQELRGLGVLDLGTDHGVRSKLK